MKNFTFSVVSDLHLDVGVHRPKLPGGKVLVIPGDLCESRSLKIHDNLDEYERECRQNLRDFINEVSDSYEHVVTVLGNHEHYHNKFSKTWHDVVENTPDNFHVLDNHTFEYEDVLFIGSTLWTDCNKLDPLTLHALRDMMNDYRCITYNQGDYYHKLRPENTVGEFRKSRDYLRHVLSNPSNEGKRVVVVTHHAPTHKSISPQYVGDQLMNGGYVSDLSEFILDRPQIAVWCHGHVHHALEYFVGDTRVVCNPYGYHISEHDFEYTGFNPDYTVTI